MAGKTEYKNKWLSKNKESINLVVPKGRKAELQARAEEQGESLNGFIVRAMDETIEMCSLYKEPKRRQAI